MAEYSGSLLYRRLIALAPVVIGIWLTLSAGTDLRQQWLRRSWLPLTGKVLNSYVQEEGNILPVVVYEYRFDGTTYRDSSHLDAPGFGTKQSRRDVAIKSIVDCPPGADLTVYVDPAEPSRSALHSHPAWYVFGRFGTGIVLVVAGIALVLTRRKSG